VQLSSPFRRKASEPDSEVAAEAAEESVATRSRAHTASKRELGKATPKRQAGGRRVEPPPSNRREAMKRMREKQREARAEARAGMLAGKEEFLPARDKGPERRVVRDIVDTRRNVGSYFLPVTILVFAGSFTAVPVVVQFSAALFYAFLLGAIVDSGLLTRRVKKIMLKRFPKATKPPRSYYFYAIMRALQTRRLRMPPPVVKVGDRIE
jgi:hypothetical protein